MPVVVSEAGYIQERLTLCTINRIRGNGRPAGLKGAAGFKPSPPDAARCKAKAAARARLEQLVVQQYAVRMCERQREAGFDADAESLPAPAPAPLRRRANAADLESLESVSGRNRISCDTVSPSSIIPVTTVKRSPARDADTVPLKSLPSSPMCSPLWQRARTLAPSPGAARFRLPRLSKEDIAEHYLAKSIGRLASPGA